MGVGVVWPWLCALGCHSSPILVGDAHEAAEVAPVSIIARQQSEPGIWVVKMTPNRGDPKPGRFKYLSIRSPSPGETGHGNRWQRGSNLEL
jgi:hypothetical protein